MSVHEYKNLKSISANPYPRQFQIPLARYDAQEFQSVNWSKYLTLPETCSLKPNFPQNPNLYETKNIQDAPNAYAYPIWHTSSWRQYGYPIWLSSFLDTCIKLLA